MNVACSQTETGTGADIASQGGEWITPPISYVDPRRRFCAFCGRPIARRFWQVGAGIFCDPAHAHEYTTYPRSPSCRLEDSEGD
jgi:hypothetical protein